MKAKNLLVNRSFEEALVKTYGENHRQGRRFEEAIKYFHKLYGEGPVQLFRAPGRVNLIGEHIEDMGTNTRMQETPNIGVPAELRNIVCNMEQT